MSFPSCNLSMCQLVQRGERARPETRLIHERRRLVRDENLEGGDYPALKVSRKTERLTPPSEREKLAVPPPIRDTATGRDPVLQSVGRQFRCELVTHRATLRRADRSRQAQARDFPDIQCHWRLAVAQKRKDRPQQVRSVAGERSERAGCSHVMPLSPRGRTVPRRTFCDRSSIRRRAGRSRPRQSSPGSVARAAGLSLEFPRSRMLAPRASCSAPVLRPTSRTTVFRRDSAADLHIAGARY